MFLSLSACAPGIIAGRCSGCRVHVPTIAPAMSDLIHMKNNRKTSQAELAKGQVWKTGDVYLQIMDRGKRLISYKMMKERGRRAVMTQMSGIAEVEAYLKANEAELIKNEA